MTTHSFSFSFSFPGFRRRNQLDLFKPRNAHRSFIRKVISGFNPSGRLTRYGLLAGAGVLVLLALAVAYILLTPKSYTSDMSLILPGAGAGSSINLSDIGQASSTTASPFAQASLSPTENYKKIILSRRVLDAAANIAELPQGTFPKPAIKLVDQTQLMIIKVKARSPQEAQRLLSALKQAFLNELELLRRSEMQIREDVYRRYIDDFRNGLRESRGAILSVQSVSGIVSLEQYQTIVSGLETTRKDMDAAKAELAESQARLRTLSSVLGINDTLAAEAFTLFTDPQAGALAERLSQEVAVLASLAMRYGEAHPERQKAARSVKSLRAALRERGRELTNLPDSVLAQLFDMAASRERGDLMKDLIQTATQKEALNARIAALEWQLLSTEKRVDVLKTQAATLDDLERDHLIGEAVFSSALARIDTSKTDVFASYPLVQVLEAPSLPTNPSAPMPKIAIAGALAAGTLWVFALVLLWIRLPVLQAILKTV